MASFIVPCLNLDSKQNVQLFTLSCCHYRDKRERVDPRDFTIENLNGETAGRAPGTINGQQFIIRNCQVSCSSLPLSLLLQLQMYLHFRTATFTSLIIWQPSLSMIVSTAEYF
jgi:hypothetical protein